MCGIFGVYGDDADFDQCLSLLDTLSHRGPDSQGHFIDPKNTLFMGHTRLSILDLSPNGNQPMISDSGDYILVFNGEIYNFKVLRDELRKSGYQFKSSGDSEVVLKSILCWGLENAVQKLEGMFSIALFSKKDKRLFLVRDRIGIKPLYYLNRNNTFAFSSEMKQLLQLSFVSKDIDYDALGAYFRFLYIPAPKTIYKDIFKLEPGVILSFNGGEINQKKYWDKLSIVESRRENCLDVSFEEALNLVENQIDKSVEKRLLSDVPVGAFLSGGIDSSLIVSSASKYVSKPLKTFTISFEEKSSDESHYAKVVSDIFKTDHHVFNITANDFLTFLPKIGGLFGEPLADGSIFPTYMLSEHTKKHVSVALAGDGGDELFGGYPRYYWAGSIANVQRILGKRGVSLLESLFRCFPKSFFDKGLYYLGGKKFSGSEGLHYRLDRLMGYLNTPSNKFYENMISIFSEPNRLISLDVNYYGPKTENGLSMSVSDQMMFLDQSYYMVDDLLTKVDHLSMYHSLEVRVPFLDHDLFELSWQLPSHYRTDREGDKGKKLLRHLLYRRLPKDIINRPKQGFGMPISSWLRGSLREWGESLLSKHILERHGLNHQYIQQLWNEHLEGKNLLSQLWTVLMYVEWAESQVKEF